MLTKTWNPEKRRYDVLFDLPAELEIDHAAVVGGFNDWDPSANPMRQDGDGRWAATISLQPGSAHRFRYHLGEDRWENDWNADDYVANEFGGSDSVVELPDAPSKPPAAKKSSAKKTAAKKTTGANKSAAKKSSAKKSSAKKSAPRKRSQ